MNKTIQIVVAVAVVNITGYTMRLFAVALFVVVMTASHPALGGIDGRELVVTLQFPAEVTPEQIHQAAETRAHEP